MALWLMGLVVKRPNAGDFCSENHGAPTKHVCSANHGRLQPVVKRSGLDYSEINQELARDETTLLRGLVAWPYAVIPRQKRQFLRSSS